MTIGIDLLSPQKSTGRLNGNSYPSSPLKAAANLVGMKAHSGKDAQQKTSTGSLLPPSPLGSESKAVLSPTKGSHASSISGKVEPLPSLSPMRRLRASSICSNVEPWHQSLNSGRCRVTSDMSVSSDVVPGARCRTTSNMCSSSQSPPKSQRKCFPRPLPQADVDWLLSTLSEEEVAKFERNFFLKDSRRRFCELDTKGTELLGIEQLQDALIEMFPTLKLDLHAEGHHMPALDKRLPSLIATFDSDADGYLDFEDFVAFVRFQQAWRSQFFLSKDYIPKPSASSRKPKVQKVEVKIAVEVTARGRRSSEPDLIGKRPHRKGLSKSRSTRLAPLEAPADELVRPSTCSELPHMQSLFSSQGHFGRMYSLFGDLSATY